MTNTTPFPPALPFTINIQINAPEVSAAIILLAETLIEALAVKQTPHAPAASPDPVSAQTPAPATDTPAPAVAPGIPPAVTPTGAPIGTLGLIQSYQQPTTASSPAVAPALIQPYIHTQPLNPPPPNHTQPLPTTQAQPYTLAQLQQACAPLMDKGLAEPIRAMLASFEVDALTKIPTAQYDLVAAQLRALGAQI